MPLSHMRRPLVLVTVSYALLLALLKAWGAFDRQGARPLRARAAVIEGRAASACVETRLGDRLVVEAESGTPEPARVEAYLARGGCEALDPLPGRLLRLRGRLRPPRPALMPGDFDEVALLQAREVSYILRVREASVVDARVPWRWQAHAWAERARRSAHRTFRRLLSPDDARLLEGLLFGTKGSLDPALQKRIQDAGVMHLLVASGTNVAFVFWGLAALLTAAGIPRRAALVPAALAGGFYCLMAGGGPPQARAYAAACAGVAAAYWPGRDAGGLQAMALSALLLLLCSPGALFSLSFQMTYAAALALWVVVPRWRPRFGPRWLRPGLRLLGISLAAQLALWPFFTNVFGRGSAIGLVANVLLVPAAGFYMAGGSALWLAGQFEPAALIAAHAMTWGLAAFKSVCAGFAALPGAAVDLLPMEASGIVAWYLSCGALFLLPEARPALRIGLLALVAWIFPSAAARAAGPRLELCFLSDRRGGAVWAGLPGGEHVLIDPGLAPARLAAALRELGARPVDAIVLTGSSRASGRGLRLAERWPVRRVLRSEGEERWGSVSLSRNGSASTLVFGRFFLTFDRKGDLATLSSSQGGPIEFCILRHPAAVAPPECAPAGIRGAGFEGALWIITDGKRYQVASSASVRPLRRPVL